MIKACVMAVLLLIGSLTSVVADSSRPVSWVSGTIGIASIRIPLVGGLSVNTVDPEREFNIPTGVRKDAAEADRMLRSMAETAGGLKLKRVSLTTLASCKAGVNFPICKFSQFSRGAASVVWIQIIHRPDMAFALKNLDLQRGREVLTVEHHSGTLPIVFLQNNRRPPYGCPDDKKFGSCWMYMQVGSDLLAVMMFWRKEDVSSLTPFDEMADAMALTVSKLITD